MTTIKTAIKTYLIILPVLFTVVSFISVQYVSAETTCSDDSTVSDPTECPNVGDSGKRVPGGDSGEGSSGGDPGKGVPPGKLNGPPIKLFDPIDKSIEEIFQAILDIIMVFAVPIIVFFIIWAGFLYVTAGGSQDKITQATKALTYAVIGGVIVLGANVLLAVITNTVKLFT